MKTPKSYLNGGCLSVLINSFYDAVIKRNKIKSKTSFNNPLDFQTFLYSTNESNNSKYFKNPTESDLLKFYQKIFCTSFIPQMRYNTLLFSIISNYNAIHCYLNLLYSTLENISRFCNILTFKFNSPVENTYSINFLKYNEYDIIIDILIENLKEILLFDEENEPGYKIIVVALTKDITYAREKNLQDFDLLVEQAKFLIKRDRFCN